MLDIDREIDSDTLKEVLSLVYQYTGISMNESKKSLLQGRMRTRMKALAINYFKDYLFYLKSHKEEIQPFINIVTTNETLFFRTKRVWEYFRSELLVKWHAENPTKTLKIWSGAASTGEELYSIVMCCEEFKSKNKAFNYNILGTDISTQVLDIARLGEYKDRSLLNLKNDYGFFYSKYFTHNNDIYTLSGELLNKVTFKQHNLFNPPPQRDYFDLVFLRNVLIYFDKKDQEKVVANVFNSLVKDGMLIIGESESLSSLNNSFNFVAPQLYKK